MAEKHIKDWSGVLAPRDEVHVHCRVLTAGMVHGDLYLTPRTWVRDAIEAKAGELVTTAFLAAFAAALGLGVAGITLTILWGAVHRG